jgi:hypothetical protein
MDTGVHVFKHTHKKNIFSGRESLGPCYGLEVYTLDHVLMALSPPRGALGRTFKK